MDLLYEVCVSGPFFFEPTAALRSSRRDGGRIISEYEDDTTLEIVSDANASQFRIRCNRMLWVQLTPSRRFIITTINGPDHTLDPANESPVERPKRTVRDLRDLRRVLEAIAVRARSC